MIDLTSTKKNKITLSDYDYKKDILSRLLLSNLNSDEASVLEELLFSPIKTSVAKISKTTAIPQEIILQTLSRLAPSGLVEIEGDLVTVDKEMRKYFEREFERFSSDFEPGMEFIQLLLKKVPIHILPLWYAIPRMTNNIFESVVERYLQTPYIYQRHLSEIQFPTPVFSAITQDLLKSPSFELSLEDIAYKYGLSDEDLQELLLHLEFNFIGTVIYRKEEDEWKGILTLFQEWKNYLTFLKVTAPEPILEVQEIEKIRPLEFSFVEDLTMLCKCIKKEHSLKKEDVTPALFVAPFPSKSYLETLLSRGKALNLIREDNDHYVVTETGIEWLDLRVENKSLYLYRHPPIHALSQRFSFTVPEKMVREIEKSVIKILHSGWVYLDAFLKGVHAPLKEDQMVILCKAGRMWKYPLPAYSLEELQLITAVLTEHLFESGLIMVGHFKGKLCLSLTAFGQSFFG
ncbi:hypothetical protein RSOCI_04265 [Rhabdochlamydiaceae symbiont of Dictyostelium giganteum]